MGKLRTLLTIVFWGGLTYSMNAHAFQEIQTEEARTPAPVEDILYARDFTLSEGYKWSSVDGKSLTDRGVIVVLRVNPELVAPRNAASPILYAGDGMLQALNAGHTSGHVIGLIPGEVNLSETIFWFGAPTAPGRLSEESIGAEREQARIAGIRPFSVERIDSVSRPAIDATNLEALLRGELADLVLEYAPGEGDLARKWRLPEAKPEPDPSRPR